MADCNKTAEFLREWDRMCLGHSCEDCKMSKYNNETGLPCGSMPRKHPDRAIAIVQEWSDNHPFVTYETKLREMLPNATISQLMDDYCPYQLFGGNAPGKGECSGEGKQDCENCWNTEYINHEQVQPKP